MWNSALAICFILSFSSVIRGRDKPFILDRVSQTYLPARYNSYGPKFCLGESSAEKVAHDPRQHILYIAGHKLAHLVDIEFPRAPIILGHVKVAGEVTDVAVCNGLVALSIASQQEIENGHVQIFSTYKNWKGKVKPVQLLFEVIVGVLPDMLLFTNNCQRLIVANEGTPGRDSKGKLRNPKGTISIVDVYKLFETDGDGSKSVKHVDFTDWDSKIELLLQRGVRWENESGHLFSEDAEPEYLTFSRNQKFVFVNLQENNAVATIDIEKGNIIDVQSLGLKPFGVQRNALDASDKDNKADLREWPIFGLYQPDSILSFAHRNEEYIVTANEGETSWFDKHSGKMWSDSLYGSSVAERLKSLPQDLRKALSDPSQLGRLAFSSLNAKNNTLVAFGSRSFSIFRARDMKLIYDSEDQLEELHSKIFPWAFNSENPEQFCAYQDSGSQDINIDSRRLFKWMKETKDKRNNPPTKQPLMEKQKLQELVNNAKQQLKEYEAVEEPWEYGLWKPSNSLTKSPKDLSDKTSRESGLSPESLEIAEIGKKRLLFVGNEKGNTIFVYDASNPHDLKWNSAIYPGNYNSTFAELYTTKQIADIDPEGMKFIPVDHSPTGEPLLVVTGSLSGTLSIYRVVHLPPHYKPSSRVRYSRKKAGVLIPSNDPYVKLFVNSEFF